MHFPKLETASVVLIFAGVSIVFAYTIISSGIFVTRTSKQSFEDGVGTAAGALSVQTKIFALDPNDDGIVDEILLEIGGLLSGGQAINLAKSTDTNDDGLLSDETERRHSLVITYRDRETEVTDLVWRTEPVGPNDGDDLLEGDERFRIWVTMAGLPAHNPLERYDTFTLELKTAKGSPTLLHKTIPGILSPVTPLGAK